ncbi:39333_t:CDS:2, partial [Gigaspora margarita]
MFKLVMDELGEAIELFNFLLNSRLNISEHEKVDCFNTFKRFEIGGDTRAHHYLALCFLNGIAVEKNTDKARELFNQTVAAEYTDSYFYYAICNKEENKDVFLKYFKLSANCNIADAQYHYGRLLYDSNDINLGLSYIRKSKKQKNIFAKKFMDNYKIETFTTISELNIENYTDLKFLNIDGRGFKNNHVLIKLVIKLCDNLSSITTRENMITFLSLSNLKSLEEFKYEHANKNNVDLYDVNVSVIIQDLPSLKEIVLNESKADDVSVINCLTLYKLSISYTRLNSLRIEKYAIITDVKINGNCLSDLDTIKHLVKLTKLDIRKSNFSGSLEPLKDMLKLQELHIDNRFDNGLEYLPPSLEILNICSSKHYHSNELIDQGSGILCALLKLGNPDK